jgi:hypothetical protein
MQAEGTPWLHAASNQTEVRRVHTFKCTGWLRPLVTEHGAAGVLGCLS